MYILLFLIIVGILIIYPQFAKVKIAQSNQKQELIILQKMNQELLANKAQGEQALEIRISYMQLLTNLCATKVVFQENPFVYKDFLDAFEKKDETKFKSLMQEHAAEVLDVKVNNPAALEMINNCENTYAKIVLQGVGLGI